MAGIFVFDASSFVDMKWRFPRDLTDELLARFVVMSKEGRWHSVGEVYRELEEKADFILTWAKANRGLFPEPDEELLRLAKEVLRHCPDLVDPEEEGPQADAYLVAQAIKLSRAQGADLFSKDEKVWVVTQEARNRKKRRIPDACQQFGLGAIDIFGFLDTEGIKTGIK